MRRLLPILLLAGLVGCDNTIVPLVPGSEGELFVYGYLDTAADTQYVRIDAVRAAAVGPRASLDDIRVMSTDQQGAETIWKHVSVELDDGQIGDVYMGLFRPQAGERYTLSASRPDGSASTTAQVTMPARPVLQPQRPRGNELTLFQTVRVTGVQRDPLRLTVLYEVLGFGSDVPLQFPVDYGATGRLQGNDWDLDVFLKRDQTSVVAQVNRDGSNREVALLSIGLRTELLTPEWDDPSAADNISNGRGFLGGIGRYELIWRLEATAVETIGFVDGQ